MLSAYIALGEVLKPQGIDGLVKVRPDTEQPERFLELTYVFVRQKDAYVSQSVSDVSVRDGFVYLRLNGASDRTAAEAQRGLTLWIDRAHARPLGENEWFVCDLIGCLVRGDKGTELGVMRDVLLSGPNPVFVVKTEKGSLLVAALKFVVKQVDVENRLVILSEDRLWEAAVYE